MTTTPKFDTIYLVQNPNGVIWENTVSFSRDGAKRLFVEAGTTFGHWDKKLDHWHISKVWDAAEMVGFKMLSFELPEGAKKLV